MKNIVLLSLLALLASPATGNEPEYGAIEHAKEKWGSTGITDYQYTLTLRENWGSSSTALVVVKNGKLETAGIIIRRSHPAPENEASENSGLRKTIDDLFAEMIIRKDFLRASFDETTGRPTDIWYQHEDWDDAENQYEIRDFSIINK